MITLYSLILCGYIVFRFIFLLPISIIAKVCATGVILLISLKHYFFLHFFGGLSSPDLPRFVIIIAGWLYVTLTFIFVLLIIRDITVCLFWLARRIGFSINFNTASWSISIGILVFSFAASTYGLYEAIRLPNIKRMDVVLKNLPKQLDGLTIVQLTDIHVNSFNPEHKVIELVETVNNIHPDLILLTGDIVDGPVHKRKKDIAPLKNLKAKYGVFGSAGNHEYYSGYDAWQTKLTELGIQMLNNSHIVLWINNTPLVLAGITDPVAEQFRKPKPNITQALIKAPNNTIRILMSHRPQNAKKYATHGIDLQLSGHTHGGQIIGLNQIVSRFNENLLVGWYDIENMKLYISPGVSLWNGFPVRFGIPSEIAVFTLRSK